MALASGHAWALAKAQAKSPKAKGHKLGDMAQDIKYPRVRVGKPAGRGRPLNPGLRDAQLFLFA